MAIGYAKSRMCQSGDKFLKALSYAATGAELCCCRSSSIQVDDAHTVIGTNDFWQSTASVTKQCKKLAYLYASMGFYLRYM